MARKCEISGIGQLTGNNRSHALNATKRTWKINLIKTRVNGKIMRLSARTFKSLRKGKIAGYTLNK